MDWCPISEGGVGVGRQYYYSTSFMLQKPELQMSRFAYLEMYNLKFQSSSFVIRVDLLHPLGNSTEIEPTLRFLANFAY